MAESKHLVDYTNFLGYPTFTGTVSSCVDQIVGTLGSGTESTYLCCLNPHSYSVARHDSLFEKSLKVSTWLVPDGIGVVLGIKFLGEKVAGRVTGSEIFAGVMKGLEERGGSAFFLGSTQSTIDAMVAKANKDFPAVRLGGLSPPFKEQFSEDDNSSIIAVVNEFRPDVLWVGMTSPKQDKWIYSNRKHLNVRFCAGVGAVFDFYAGKVNRPSKSFRKLGLEWLPRLLREPSRLWKRTLVSGPIFVYAVMSYKVKQWIRKYFGF